MEGQKREGEKKDNNQSQTLLFVLAPGKTAENTYKVQIFI